MNREIKFRGLVADEVNTWVYGYLVANNIISQVEEREEGKCCGIGTFIVIPETIGQFTGLKDTAGKEIYEGDLLKYQDGDSEVSEIDEVFYNEDYGTFEVAINRNIKDTEVLGFYLSRLNVNTKYEVIGNIYEAEDD
jgi:uncharacterized phage protein (TIGR01671 family)